MRVSIYARYSSELQRAASIEDQVLVCTERLVREKWTLVATYTDRGVSGASHLRPGYQGLLAGARNREFDIVLAEALDRISRDQEHVASFFKQMRFAGIRVFTLAEGEIGELHVGLKGTMNALFLKDLAEKTRRGLRGRIEAGGSGGGVCFGYNVVRETAPDGMPMPGGRRINETEAEVVRKIFRAFASGLSPRRIAFDLNHERIPAPGAAGWGASTINGNATRGTGILNNELYIGRLVWNRLRYIKDPMTGRRVSRLNPQSEWIIHEVPELQIVDPDLWGRVKMRQAEFRKNTRPDCGERPFWAMTRPKYLLSGLLRCGACGGAYTKINANLFGCATARNKGTCNNRINIRRDAIETMVLNGLKHRLMDPDLFKVFVEEFTKEFNRLRAAEGNQIDQTKAELVGVERRLKKIVDAIADGVSARTLKEELMTLEARQDELRGLLARPEPDRPFIHPNLAEAYRRKVAALHEALAEEASRLEAMELIRSLVDAITLVPENGILRVEVRGELAAILALAAGRKQPGRDDRVSAKQIKMVAGARNLLYRTRTEWRRRIKRPLLQ
ncbi:MAG: recombinase family protein, partial [Xanthobacteraceae bacterium]